jgi:surface antigen
MFTTGHLHQGPYLAALGARSHVQWAWTVPSHARRASWKATVLCASTRAGLRSRRSSQRFTLPFAVTGPPARKASAALARRHASARSAKKSIRTTLGIVLAGSMRVTTAATPLNEGSFAAAPVNSHGNGLGSGGGLTPGGFEPDQCTGWADERRPDIHAYAVAHGVQPGGWNGNMWGIFAARAGMPTGTTPAVGAIASFQGGSYGHVAYVESVNPDGSYVVSEENYGPSEWNAGSEEPGYPDAPDPSLRVIYSSPPGTIFIYGGPGGGRPPGGGTPGGGTEGAAGGGAGGLGESPALAVGPSGLPTVVADGPSNSLYAYWETPDAQWHGPLGIGVAGGSYSPPAIGASSTGNPTVVVQGPSNSLYAYWETPDAQWHGPLGIGAAGSTFSAPSIAVGSSGQPTVVVQGPSNSLYAYWETPDAQWHGPLGIGAAGSTFSAPSIAVNASGLPTVAVQADSNSLHVYWETPDAQWHGPLGIGAASSTYSAPSITSTDTILVQGPNNSLHVYWETPDAQWHGPLGIDGAGSTFSAPSAATTGSGLPATAVQGPTNSLYAYWETPDAQWHGPLGIGAAGSTH